MFKKLFIVVGVVALGGILWANTDVGSYIKTGCKEAKAWFKGAVPVEFEIKRAKEMVASLDKEADKMISVLAKEMVAIENYETQVAEGEAWLKTEAQAVRDAKEDLKTDRTFFVGYFGEVSRDHYALELQRRFNTFRLREAAHENHKVSLVNHRETMSAAREQLEAIKAQKADLQARVEKLETDLQIVKAQEARSKGRSKFDDSKLAKVRELVESIEQSIQERRYEVQLREGQPAKAVKVTPSVSPNLVEQIESHFGGVTAETATAGK